MLLSTLVKKKLEILKEEYDLSDLAANDMLQLTNLAEALASQDVYNKLLSEELDSEEANISRVKEIQRLITEVTKNIATISDSLKIDRKSREKKTESVPDYVKDLKLRAKRFLDQRLSYIYCPKCKILVATMWLSRYNQGAKFKFICQKCNDSFIVSDSELDNRKNIDSAVVPQN